MKTILTLTALWIITLLPLSAQTEIHVNSSEKKIPTLISIGWYPNPVTIGEKIKVEIELNDQQELKTELLDALGRKVFEVKASYPLGKSRIHIHTKDLNQGLYFVRVSTDVDSYTEKVIIK